jgi:hypothetical protein
MSHQEYNTEIPTHIAEKVRRAQAAVEPAVGGSYTVTLPHGAGPFTFLNLMGVEACLNEQFTSREG